MKQNKGSTPDYSKSSFFNCGNQLFSTEAAINTQFFYQGAFQMRYQSKLSTVKIEQADTFLKIIEEKQTRYICFENSCLRVVFNQKNQQFGFRLSQNGQYAEFFGMNLELFDKIKLYVIQPEFMKKYKLIQNIGTGYRSSIYKVKHLINGNDFAVKIIDKSQFNGTSSQDKENILNEIAILRQINQKNLIKLEEIYEGEQYIYIVTNLLEGGTIKQIGFNMNLSEQQMLKLIHTLFSSLNYIHQMNICHNEIQFDHILLNDSQDILSACLIHFGKAMQIPSKTKCQTYFYPIDQEKMKQLNIKRDIFSLSIILLSIFTKKQFQENQLVDELLMKNYDIISVHEYWGLPESVQLFFKHIFVEQNKQRKENLSCQDILDLDIFKSGNIVGKAKSPNFHLPNIGRKLSKLEPRLSQKEKLEISLPSLKLPQVHNYLTSTPEKTISTSPSSERILRSNKLLLNNLRKNALKQQMVF